MKVGVVGLGEQGKRHARVYAKEMGQDLFIFDADKRACRACEYGTPCSDATSLLRKVDAVSICTPTTVHRDAAIAAIEYGVPVLIEKPVAESVASAKTVYDAAKRRNVPVAVGYAERFNPKIARLRSLIGEDEEIHGMDFKRLNPYPPRIKDVGVIVDMAVHDIDISGFISEERPREVFAHASSKEHPTREFDDNATMMLAYEGFVSTVRSDWLTPTRIRTVSVHTSRAFYEADLLVGGKVHEYDRYAGGSGDSVDLSTASMKVHTPKETEPLVEELTHFLEFAKTGKGDTLATIAEGVDVQKIAEAAQISAKRGEAVVLNWE